MGSSERGEDVFGCKYVLLIGHKNVPLEKVRLYRCRRAQRWQF